MIEKIIIRNFKSIKRQEVTLKEFNLIIGANNTGKSNFLDCLLILADIFRNPLEGVFGRGPFSYASTFCRDGQKYNEPLGIRLIYKSNFDILDYEIEIRTKHNGRYNETYVQKEVLKKNGVDIKRTSGTKDSFIYTTRMVTSDESFKFLTNNLKVRKYQFYPKDIKKRQTIGDNEPGFIPFLSPNGDNLLDVLYNIRENDTSRYSNILQDCQKFFPYLHNITLQRAGESFFEMQVTMKIDRKEWRFVGAQLSDGFVIILAIITLLNFKTLPNIILIEELENGLNPASIEKVLLKIFETSRKKNIQFFISSHSPVFMQLLKNNPEYIIVCELENGLSKYTHLDEKLAMFQGDYQKEDLWDVWFSGLIGGL